MFFHLILHGGYPMNSHQVLVELARLEAFLKRCNDPYYMIVGHYKRWLATAVPDEVPFIKQRLTSLFVGSDSLNMIVLDSENGHRVDNKEQANQMLDRMRLSLADAIESPPQAHVKDLTPIKPVLYPLEPEPNPKKPLIFWSGWTLVLIVLIVLIALAIVKLGGY